MTSGNGTEQPGEEPEDGPVDRAPEGCAEDSGDGEDTTAGPPPDAGADRPRTSRRKTGVEYRPV